MKLFIVLVTLPILCIATTDNPKYNTDASYQKSSSNHHHHHHSTRDGRDNSTEDHSRSTSEEFSTSFEELTNSSQRSCRSLSAKPALYMTALDFMSNSAEVKCVCELEGITESECPQWKGVTNTLHSYKLTLSRDQCVTTLNIKALSSDTPYIIYCTDVMSGQSTKTRLQLDRSRYGQPCLVPGVDKSTECVQPLSCKESGSEYGTCLCPSNQPVYNNGRCYRVAKLSEPCDYSVQCKASDKNSYCLGPDGENGSFRRCLCGPGYEIGYDGTCVCEDCGLKYVYSCTKRYYIVFYVLLSLSLLFILIGLLKVCLLHRRAIAKRPGVVISTRQEDSNPIIEAENPREKN